MPAKNKCQSEAAFKRYVVRQLKGVNHLYFFIKEARSIRGIPDIIGCCCGRMFGWELKKSAKVYEKGSDRQFLQRYELLKIEKAGGIGRFVYPENFEYEFKVLRALSE